uniref:Uncharacterized protein n=1 Tax=Oryza rufipogon TaxID=4529 RepID=A0A0E0QQF1_ORYRU
MTLRLLVILTWSLTRKTSWKLLHATSAKLQPGLHFTPTDASMENLPTSPKLPEPFLVFHVHVSAVETKTESFQGCSDEEIGVFFSNSGHWLPTSIPRSPIVCRSTPSPFARCPQYRQAVSDALAIVQTATNLVGPWWGDYRYRRGDYHI